MPVTGLNDPASRIVSDTERLGRTAARLRVVCRTPHGGTGVRQMTTGVRQRASRNGPAIVTRRHADVLAKAAGTMALIGEARCKSNFGKGEFGP